MPDLVVFRLAAPVAAFGDIAVGERRGTYGRPSHSAITGLVASALGMPRDLQGHEALAAGFHLALRTDSGGIPHADFHTVQTPPRQKGRHFATRADELAEKNNLGTIVSRRDYLTDIAFTVLLWPAKEATLSATAIVTALNRPVFAPYAGRRSCPLGAPVAAILIQAESVVDAFAAYDAKTQAHRELALMLNLPWHPGEIVFDAELREVRGDGLSVQREEIRRDRLVSRARWQFAPRAECVAAPPRRPGKDHGEMP